MADETGASADAEALEEMDTGVEAPAAKESSAEPAAQSEEQPQAPSAEAEEPEPAPDAREVGAEDPVAEGTVATGEGTFSASAKPKRKRLPRALRPARSKPKREQSAKRKPVVRLPKPEHERGRRQERQGTVVSSAMEKTIVVEVDVIKAHPRYKKVVRRSVKFHAHDEENVAKVGDIVRIVETRPLSATKRWRLAEIVEAAK